MDIKHRKAICTASFIVMLSAPAVLRADEQSTMSNTISGTTKEYLSDPARTGSIVGSIIAGSAVANPLAPLLGSVVGFMIGKSSAFSGKDSDASRRDAYLNRSLVPENGLEAVTGLTGLTGGSSQASDETVVLGLPSRTISENLSDQGEPIVIVESPSESVVSRQSGHTNPLVMVPLPDDMGLDDMSDQSDQVVSLGLNGAATTGRDLQMQLAGQCSNVKPSQPMPLTCYYYSQ